jgi:hypothetical protein
MDDRLVCDCSHVLSTLSGTDLHINQIIRQTGLYKDYVRGAIKELHAGKLIKENKHPHYAQRKVKTLTELGRIFVTLKDGIGRFQESYNALQIPGKSVLDLTQKDPKLVQKILKDKRWTKGEIDNYPEWTEQLRMLLGYTLRLFSDALFASYTMIMSRFDVNKHAKPILIKIFTDGFSEHLSSRPGRNWICPHCGVLNPDISHVFDELNPGIFDFIGDFDLTNKFANKEIQNLLTSSFLVMAPPKKYLEHRLNDEKDIIERMGNESNTYLSKARVAFYEEAIKSV